MARAADFHLILREHQEPDHAVLEAALRGWKPMEPVTLKWEFPLWIPTDLDPKKLKRPTSSAQSRRDEDGEQCILNALQEANGHKMTQRKLRTASGMGPDRLNRLAARLKAKGALSIETVVVDHNESLEYQLQGVVREFQTTLRPPDQGWWMDAYK